MGVEEKNLNYVAGPLTIFLDVDSRMMTIRHHRKFSTLFHKSITNLLFDEKYLNVKRQAGVEFVPSGEYYYFKIVLSDEDFITVITNQFVYWGDSDLIFNQN
jgi:hypothetical protein